ncbi:hypothetical protein OIB37_03810 [Streptomyces sp. NBC_00820]|uniref:hypothetical protein n=1 Tax=Streptomyces sp. NBC_00820 TaxID=2975842 RepID=UPI002ED5DA0A|nr:hypothetical protein OIB37_03810 [Streptomyces sp. NBC_00820]
MTDAGEKLNCMPDQYHHAFTRWLTRLREDIDVDFNPFAPDPGVSGWLLSLFRDNGELTTGHLAPYVMARRTVLAESAVAALTRDIRAAGHPAPDIVIDVMEPDPQFSLGKVSVESTHIQSVDAQGVLAEAADGVQTYLACPGRTVWPTCPDHGLGVHPSAASGVAEWVCSAGHILRPICQDLR